MDTHNKFSNGSGPDVGSKMLTRYNPELYHLEKLGNEFWNDGWYCHLSWANPYLRKHSSEDARIRGVESVLNKLRIECSKITSIRNLKLCYFDAEERGAGEYHHHLLLSRKGIEEVNPDFITLYLKSIWEGKGLDCLYAPNELINLSALAFDQNPNDGNIKENNFIEIKIPPFIHQESKVFKGTKAWTGEDGKLHYKNQFKVRSQNFGRCRIKRYDSNLNNSGMFYVNKREYEWKEGKRLVVSTPHRFSKELKKEIQRTADQG